MIPAPSGESRGAADEAVVLQGVALGAIVSVVTLASTAAIAGTRISAVFNLGKSNSVDAKTTITESTVGGQLQITNTSTAAGATGIGIDVARGNPRSR
jgi:hypothetical protein